MGTVSLSRPRPLEVERTGYGFRARYSLLLNRGPPIFRVMRTPQVHAAAAPATWALPSAYNKAQASVERREGTRPSTRPTPSRNRAGRVVPSARSLRSQLRRAGVYGSTHYSSISLYRAVELYREGRGQFNQYTPCIDCVCKKCREPLFVLIRFCPWSIEI